MHFTKASRGTATKVIDFMSTINMFQTTPRNLFDVIIIYHDVSIIKDAYESIVTLINVYAIVV